MSIWRGPFTLEQITALSSGSMVSHLGIEFVEIGDDYLTARMPVDERTLQPYGIMHGGASCVLAETVASVAGGCCIDPSLQQVVGIEINTSHIRSASSGWAIGTARPLHLGGTTQVWEIAIRDDDARILSMSRLRMAVLQKRS